MGATGNSNLKSSKHKPKNGAHSKRTSNDGRSAADAAVATTRSAAAAGARVAAATGTAAKAAETWNAARHIAAAAG